MQDKREDEDVTSEDDHPQNYDWGYGECEKGIFLQCFKTFMKVKSIFMERTLSEKDFPKIKKSDHSVFLANALKDCCQGNFSHQRMIYNIYNSHSEKANQLLLLTIWDLVVNIIVLSLFQYLVSLISDPSSGRLQLIVILLCLFIFFALKILALNKINYQSAVFAVQIRNSLMMVMMEKIQTMSGFMLQQGQIGKISNMFMSDFSFIIVTLHNLVNGLTGLIKALFVIGIIIFRMGWTASFSFVAFVITLAYQYLIGKFIAVLISEVNQHKDERIKVSNELFEGVRLIKLYGWEIAFRDIVQKVRKSEIQSYVKLKIAQAFQRMGQTGSSFFISFSTFFFVYSFGGEEDLSSFKILALLQPIIALGEYLWFIGSSLTIYYYVKIYLERFEDIMNQDNFRLYSLENSPEKAQEVLNGEVNFSNFSAYKSKASEKDQNVFLSNINFRFKKGGFYGIIGKVGSGKSALLSAILAEVPFCKGSIIKNGSIASVEQEPVVFATTVKKNILFGKDFDQKKYEQTIKICSLQDDLQNWEDGEETLVGERGITLSGGQKARLALARAIYADCEIYLLDDPLSAVDSKVGKKIYEALYKKLRGRKTTILVTHMTHYLENCDHILIMEQGRIKAVQSPYQFRKQTKLIEQIHEQHKQEINMKQNYAPKKYRQEKNIEITVANSIYYCFYHKLNYIFVPLAVIFLLSYEIVASVIFRLYAMYDEIALGKNYYFENLNEFWIGMILIHLISMICQVLRSFFVSLFILKSNQKIHEDMILAMIRTPLSYFDLTPTGQIINKFANDLGQIDNMMPLTLILMLEKIALWIIMVGNIIQMNKIYIFMTIITVFLLILLYIYCQKVLFITKQISLQLNSPIQSKLQEIVSGTISIQTLNQVQNFKRSFAGTLNKSLKSQIHYHQNRRFFAISANYITIFVFFIFIAIILKNMDENEEKSLQFILQLLFAFRMMESLQIMITLISESEGFMVNIGRTLETIQTPSQMELKTQYDFENQIFHEEEDCKDMGDVREWPQKANIQMRNLKLRYNQDDPFVLNGISFSIKDGEKVGIVGRTGAGKSSVLQALFRVVQPEKGTNYEIGNCNALRMGLHSLRMSMSIIPQTPFLFRGSIKQNIDPFNKKSEQEIWRAFSFVQLDEKIRKMPKQLDTQVSNSAESFSVGQKQLFCLSRALLRRKRFLILDEATSNIDSHTDTLLQDCIRREFRSTTVLTIAHRLTTIADYDKLMVLDKGKVAQMGSPHQLLLKKGLFAEMVSNSGKIKEEIQFKARQHHSEMMS